MKVLIAGHRYALENFENIRKGDEQIIQFIQKRPVQGNPGNPNPVELETVYNGTTNEEVLAMLIDRMKFLNERFPCRENLIVITKLEESLMWLNHRTAERKMRGVEGTHQK